MECKREWSIEFIQTLGKTWIKEEYRSMREKMLFEHEKTFLPPLQQEAVFQKKVDEIEEKAKQKSKEIKENESNIDQLVRTQMENRERLQYEWQLLNRERFRLQTPFNRHEEQKTNVVMKCIQSECRGFLNTNYKCELCSTTACKHCHVVKDDGHECKPNDVATVQELERTTKPCPKCHIRIYKIDGCDQMFCIQCHTAFSWRTGQVESGVIHNPHYFEALRAGNIVDPRHRQEHGGCGPMPHFNDIRRVMSVTTEMALQTVITNYYQRFAHIRNHHLQQYVRVEDDDIRKDRISYLIGKLDDNKFKSKLFVRHQRYQRKQEERQILESYCAIGEELFRSMTRLNIKEIVEQLKMITSITHEAAVRIDKKYQHKGLLMASHVAPIA